MAYLPRGWLAAGLEQAAAEHKGLIEALSLAGRERDEARKERDALRTELRAREWLDEQGVAVIVTPGFIFVGIDGVAFAYASYAAAARALGWEG